MRTSIRRTLCATAVAGGFTVLGIAFAASSATAADNTTSGASALASGNQTGTGIQAPVKAAGNQVTVIGDGNNNAASSTPDRAPANGSSSGSSNGSSNGGGQSTSGQDGAGSGNQTDADAVVPVKPSGNQVTVIGDGNKSDAPAKSSNQAATGAPGSRDPTPPTARTAPVRATRATLTPWSRWTPPATR